MTSQIIGQGLRIKPEQVVAFLILTLKDAGGDHNDPPAAQDIGKHFSGWLQEILTLSLPG